MSAWCSAGLRRRCSAGRATACSPGARPPSPAAVSGGSKCGWTGGTIVQSASAQRSECNQRNKCQPAGTRVALAARPLAPSSVSHVIFFPTPTAVCSAGRQPGRGLQRQALHLQRKSRRGCGREYVGTNCLRVGAGFRAQHACLAVIMNRRPGPADVACHRPSRTWPRSIPPPHRLPPMRASSPWAGS